MANMMNKYCEKSTCCIESTGRSIDPTEVCGTVIAGSVSSNNEFTGDCMLAKIYFPSQVYRAGFMPDVALQHGTLYPELVRLYK